VAAERPDMAEPLLQRILDKRPNDPGALNLMADIARRAHRFEEAEGFLARAIAQAPEGAGYRFNYAVLLRRLERFTEALAQLDALLLQEPQNALFQEQKAAVLQLMGRHDEVLTCRQQLITDFPQWQAAWVQYGDALRALGQTGDCITAYRKALEIGPLAAAYVNLADLKTFRFDPAEIAAMEMLLSDPSVPAAERSELHFALGKAHGDEEQYAKAFENYARGNALQRAGLAFDPETFTAFRIECEKAFTPEFFRMRNDWGAPSAAPIFVVGMPRSGSTLIEQILSTHSAIEGLGELAELDSVVGRMMSREEGGRPAHEFWIGGWFEFRKGLIDAFPRVMQRFGAKEFGRLSEDYLHAASRFRRSARPMFADKGLRNFGYVPLIHLILPRAKIIDVRRHPLDCGWSIFRSHFPGGQPFSNRLADIGSHYANYVSLMAHFDRVLPGRIHRVIYEDLVADPEPQLRHLFAYLDLPFEDQCLRFHKTRRAVGTISAAQVRTPLNSRGVAQWVPYEQWLGPLKSALGPLLDHHTLPR
jgi:Flp pilus assembly protein TadD